jgi:hypothetical protein
MGAPTGFFKIGNNFGKREERTRGKKYLPQEQVSSGSEE